MPLSVWSGSTAITTRRFAAFVKADLELNGKIAKIAKIKPE